MARSKGSRIAKSRPTACSITPKRRPVRTTATISSSDSWNRWSTQPSVAEVAGLQTEFLRIQLQGWLARFAGEQRNDLDRCEHLVRWVIWNAAQGSPDGLSAPQILTTRLFDCGFTEFFASLLPGIRRAIERD